MINENQTPSAKPGEQSGLAEPICSAIRPTPRMMLRKVTINYDATRGQFEALHKAGAEKFGGAWLAANQAIAEYCPSRVDISDPAVKELLSLAALRVLMRLQLHGYLPNDGAEACAPKPNANPKG